MDNGHNFPIDKPIRLKLAAEIAYPDGSMTVAGLRKERDAGRLVTEMTAGKEYTTLAAIEKMRELCRVHPKEPALSGGTKAGRPTGRSAAKPAGTSKTADVDIAWASAKETLKQLKDGSLNTSPKSTNRRVSGTVTPIR